MQPRWNEDEALNLFSPLEWQHISKIAFDTGSEAEEAVEKELPDDVDVPLDADDVLPRARIGLQESSLLGPFRDDPNVQAVWEYNFFHGWRAADSGFNAYIFVESPG